MVTHPGAAGGVEAEQPGPEEEDAQLRGVSRRRFIGYVLAAPTLVAGAELGKSLLAPLEVLAAIASAPQASDIQSLNDLLTYATMPTSALITVVINKDGTASFDFPRTESGQGITTSTAMLIAEELNLPLDKIHITLADARPELIWNQFTAGSNTTISTYTPVRVAAAIAMGKLMEAASIFLGDTVNNLEASGGFITSLLSGRSVSYGDLAELAASSTMQPVAVALKDASQFKIIGTPQTRIDALDSITGRKQYTMDLKVPGARPAMICRPPTINGTVVSVNNKGAVLAMSGVSDVVVIPTGVAVVADTFGQCVDAVRALNVTWGPGSVDSESDSSVLAKLRAAAIPFAIPTFPFAKTITQEFVFHFRNNTALEPQTAIADVRAGSAEVWSCMQAPIVTQETLAEVLGLPPTAIKAHVTYAGGAFGRRMFTDVVVEAAQISKAAGKPVKLMWHRTDEMRWGRTHPMCISQVRASYLGGNVLTFEQRHTSVSTDYTMGFGEILTALLAMPPDFNQGYSQVVFNTTANVPYNFGAVTQAINEIFQFNSFHTGSVRNIYNPDVVTAVESVVDQIARGMGQDPYRFRRSFLKDPRAVAVLDKVAQVGHWGRPMAPGTAQGLAVHTEYKGATAALVEIDCTPQTVNRPLPDGIEGITGPRVTKLVFAIDAGLAINPRGLEAQMVGGANDAIGQVLTESMHLQNGNFLEGSWDNYFYTRQWNTPLDVTCIVMPPTTGVPGGAGEFGVAATKAAVANALARATGTVPTSFPINHNGPLAFAVYPFVPPVPPSPTDGLSRAY